MARKLPPPFARMVQDVLDKLPDNATKADATKAFAEIMPGDIMPSPMPMPVVKVKPE